MPWTTPGTVDGGDVYAAARYNTDTVGNLLDLDERLRASKSLSKYRLFANDNIFSNPTAFTVLPNATDKAALDLSFTKVLGTASSLHVQVHGTIIFTSGASQLMSFGARCILSGGGTTDLTCSQFLFPGATTRQYFGGVATGTALASGVYTITPIVRSAGAAAIQFTANNDSMSIMATESPI